MPAALRFTSKTERPFFTYCFSYMPAALRFTSKTERPFFTYCFSYMPAARRFSSKTERPFFTCCCSCKPAAPASLRRQRDLSSLAVSPILLVHSGSLRRQRDLSSLAVSFVSRLHQVHFEDRETFLHLLFPSGPVCGGSASVPGVGVDAQSFEVALAASCPCTAVCGRPGRSLPCHQLTVEKVLGVRLSSMHGSK